MVVVVVVVVVAVVVVVVYPINSRHSTIRLVVQDFLHPPNMSLFLLNC